MEIKVKELSKEFNTLRGTAALLATTNMWISLCRQFKCLKTLPLPESCNGHSFNLPSDITIAFYSDTIEIGKGFIGTRLTCKTEKELELAIAFILETTLTDV